MFTSEVEKYRNIYSVKIAREIDTRYPIIVQLVL